MKFPMLDRSPVAAGASKFDRAEMFGVSALWSVSRQHCDAALSPEQRQLLLRMDVVDALLGLPVDEWVAAEALSPRHVRLFRNFPDEVLGRRSNGEVLRRVSEPVRVDHALVTARSFRRGLELASTFGMYCARSLQLPNTVPVSEFECAEAAYRGVGLFRAIGGGRREEIVPPEPFPCLPATAASWVFAERLFSQLP